MYAVFEDGSRQYKVSEGGLVTVDYRENEKGSRIEFPRVLLYASGTDVQIGQPVVEGARVVGEVVDHPSIKTLSQRYHRRKNVRRVKGHRQYYTLVRVRHILLAGQEPPAAPAPAPSQPQAPAATPPASTPTPGTPS
jgi:large subunit ribosomal protein L21